jgi:3-oxoacyl-[acyl-carrier protein] reductase
MEISLENQVAVITGGSRGIGAATVRAFAEAGAQVVLNYRKAATAAGQVICSCGQYAPNVVAVRADVSKMADARRLIDKTVRRFGRLDVLVANAGIWNAKRAPIECIPEHKWDAMIEVNLKGVYSVIHYAVPQMRDSGRIVVLSSTAGQRGEAFHTHYGASKGGVISFVKGLATELAGRGIRVNCVAPGWVDTDMVASVVGDAKELEGAMRNIPLRRFSHAEEIAGPILFLASGMASYITGEVLNVNGGSVLCG